MKMYDPLPGETEILCVRRFPLFILFVAWDFFLRTIGPFIIGVIVFYIFGNTFDNIIVKFSLASYLIFVAGMVLLAFVEWLNEELDILIVTDRRIIIFIQHTLFKRHSSIAALHQVQDVKGVTNGIVRSFLNIGNLEIQTAADKIQFVMEDVYNPDDLARTINANIHYAKQGGDDDGDSGTILGLKNNNFLDQLLDTRTQLKKLI